MDELIAAKVITTSPIVVRGRSKLETEMRNQQLQRYLDYTAQEINEGGPVKLDSLTTRTGAQAAPHTLTLRFVLDVEKAQLEPSLAKRKLTPILTKQTCTDRKMKLAAAAGATFVFSYSDRHGKEAFKVAVSKCESE